MRLNLNWRDPQIQRLLIERYLGRVPPEGSGPAALRLDLPRVTDRDYVGEGEDLLERPPEPLRCEGCNEEVRAVRRGQEVYQPADIARRTRQRYGSVLCWDCARAAQRSAG